MKEQPANDIKTLKTELEAVKKDLPEMMMLYEMMQSNDIPFQDVFRALALIVNVKKVSQWGKITILLKEGQIVAVQQEQQFVTSRELERIKR